MKGFWSGAVTPGNGASFAAAPVNAGPEAGGPVSAIGSAFWTTAPAVPGSARAAAAAMRDNMTRITFRSYPDARAPWGNLSAGVELEHDAGDLDVVARLEALGLERVDHAERPQPLLDVRQRLLVAEVVAGEQALDPRSGDAEPALGHALHVPTASGRGAGGAVLGPRRDLGRLRRRRLERGAPEDLARQHVEAEVRRRRRDDHRHALVHGLLPRLGRRRAPQPLAPRRRSGIRLLVGHEVGLGQREDPREPGEPLVVRCELVLDRLPVGERIRAVERREVEHVDEQPRALDVREEVVAEPGA